MIVPTKTESVPIVAELPMTQKTEQPPPFVMRTWEPLMGGGDDLKDEDGVWIAAVVQREGSGQDRVGGVAVHARQQCAAPEVAAEGGIARLRVGGREHRVEVGLGLDGSRVVDVIGPGEGAWREPCHRATGAQPEVAV